MLILAPFAQLAGASVHKLQVYLSHGCLVDSRAGLMQDVSGVLSRSCW